MGRKTRTPVFKDGDPAENTYRTTLVVRRYGQGTLPLDVRVLVDSDEDVRWHCDGPDRWKLFELVKPVRGRRAEVDPEDALMLDMSRTNNSDLINRCPACGDNVCARVAHLATGPSADLRVSHLT